MKILLTVHQFLPDYSSGTEVLTYKVAKELQRRGHQVIVFSGALTKAVLDDEQRFDRYAYDGIEVVRFWHGFVPMGGQSDVMEIEYDLHLAARYFKAVLERERPDVVHFFHLGRVSTSLIPVCVDQHVPTFFTPTDFGAVCPLNQLLLPDGKLCGGPDALAANCIFHMAHVRYPPLGPWLYRLPTWLKHAIVRAVNAGLGANGGFARMIRSASRRQGVVVPRINSTKAVFAPNHFMADVLVRNGIDQALIQVSPFGIDLDLAACPHRPDPSGLIRIGFIGTLSRNKGAHLLVEAVRKVPGLPVELSIYGDLAAYPAYTRELRESAGDDERIRFRGTFDNKDINQVFSGLDMLAVPSIWYENTPLVIYSAQAYGCPVMASDLGAVSEVIRHDDNGLLFPSGDVDELAGLLVRLVNDREIIPRLASRARTPRSIVDYVAELFSYYRRAVEK